MTFTEDIRDRADELHQAILIHPFVTGIGDGSLGMDRFKYFIRQDYLFLIEYCRVLALAVAKSPSLEYMGRFGGILNETLNTEMALHRDYCFRLGITQAELETTEPSPTMLAYTNFLVRIAYHGSFGELTCALLPCMWGYCEIGLTLAEQGLPSDQPLYSEWIEMYSTTEFQALAKWLRGLVDQLAEGANSEEQERMEKRYVTSTRYEYAFWNMAYRLEEWPV